MLFMDFLEKGRLGMIIHAWTRRYGVSMVHLVRCWKVSCDLIGYVLLLMEDLFGLDSQSVSLKCFFCVHALCSWFDEHLWPYLSLVEDFDSHLLAICSSDSWFEPIHAAVSTGAMQEDFQKALICWSLSLTFPDRCSVFDQQFASSYRPHLVCAVRTCSCLCVWQQDWWFLQVCSARALASMRQLLTGWNWSVHKRLTRWYAASL